MQQLMRWEPFRDADEFFRSFLPTSRDRPPASPGESRDSWPSWMPAVDIRETDAEYGVQAEVPGLRREDLKIRVEDNVLTLQGERTQERGKRANAATGSSVRTAVSAVASACRRMRRPRR